MIRDPRKLIVQTVVFRRVLYIIEFLTVNQIIMVFSKLPSQEWNEDYFCIATDGVLRLKCLILKIFYNILLCQKK
jgi:hypothetical protein